MPRLMKDYAYDTVTIGELIAKLSEYPPDMAVAYRWEGQVTCVDLDEFKIMQSTDKVIGPVLLMNAET